MSEWWSNSKLIIYIKKDEYEKYYGKEHGYLIMNHSYEIDWLMGWHFCNTIGVLGVSIFIYIYLRYKYLKHCIYVVGLATIIYYLFIYYT